MKPYILIAVLVTIVVAELFCSLKEREWRVAAERRLAEATAASPKPPEPRPDQQTEIAALQARIGDLQTEIGALQARLETIGRQNREVLDKYVAAALRLKAAEADVVKLRAAAPKSE